MDPAAIGACRRMSAAGAAFVNGTAAMARISTTPSRRPGACRRRHRAGGARRLRAAQSGRARRASRHHSRRRDHLPAQRRGAQGRAQGRLSSDRCLRRHGGRRRGRRRARLDRKQLVDALGIVGSMAGHHRVSRRGHLDQAHARGLGRAIRPARRAARARRLHRPAHRARGVHGLFHGFAHTAQAITPR